MFAQIATDARTGTLGVAFVNAPAVNATSTTLPPTMVDIDRQARAQVEVNATLEPYRVFWEPPLSEDEFVPTRGCSLPTFHGSTADLAAIAASLLNLIALHIDQNESARTC